MSIARPHWILSLALVAAGALAAPAAADFPQADSGYHNYAEITADTAQIVADHPLLAQRISIGRSYEGRDIWAVKVSDNVAVDEPEPEALFDANQHAREHLTTEQAMYLLSELTTKYATDARIRDIVASREIWIVPTVNPDGLEYDISDGNSYRGWRKNRQPDPPSNGIGTDLNRNWGWQWGCCDGSSSDPSDEEYRGASAFSAPETRALSDFVLSRRVGGVQQIRVAIDFHSSGELVMWPFAYTYSDTAPGMTQDQRDAFAALGQSMAQSNGYRPQQASDLYISDGNMRDWMWGSQGIFAYGFELSGGQNGFYPPDEFIPSETARNREAVLRLLETADCPYRAIGKEFAYCAIGTDPGTDGGGPPGGTGTPPAAPPPPPPPAVADDPGGDGAATANNAERATATVVPARARLDAAGHVRLRVHCGAVATRCRGTLKLAARLPGSPRVVTIAKTNYVMTPGTEAIALRLGPKSRRALRRRSTIAVTATITSWYETTGDSTTTSKRVKLVRPARRR